MRAEIRGVGGRSQDLGEIGISESRSNFPTGVVLSCAKWMDDSCCRAAEISTCCF